MPSQLINGNASAELLAPLNPDDLWPVTGILDWSEGDDEGSRTDIDMVRTSEGTFAALGINGGVDNGAQGFPDYAERDPDEVFDRRIKLARIGVWNESPFGDGRQFISGIRKVNEIASLMEDISEPEAVTAVAALGETIRERRRISYEEQIVYFNDLVQQEKRVMLRFEEARSRQVGKGAKLALLQGFSLVGPEAVAEGEKEQDFSVGVILGDRKDQVGVKPKGYTATGVYIPSEPASWLSRRNLAC